MSCDISVSIDIYNLISKHLQICNPDKAAIKFVQIHGSALVPEVPDQTFLYHVEHHATYRLLAGQNDVEVIVHNLESIDLNFGEFRCHLCYQVHAENKILIFKKYDGCQVSGSV